MPTFGAPPGNAAIRGSRTFRASSSTRYTSLQWRQARSIDNGNATNEKASDQCAQRWSHDGVLNGGLGCSFTLCGPYMTAFRISLLGFLTDAHYNMTEAMQLSKACGIVDGAMPKSVR